ncbi:MAG: hypothetical protein IJ204_03825 [Paludibacteraceae bacterium]|nr:hypothetical protein [Paludibacteraceae bacterium]
MDEIEESGGKNATEGNNGGSRNNARERKTEGRERRERREREYVCAFENKGNGPLEVFWI